MQQEAPVHLLTSFYHEGPGRRWKPKVSGFGTLFSTILMMPRFVEIKWITIRNARGKSKHSVLITHKSGATESFVSEEKRSEVKLACGRYVSLDSAA